MHDSGWSFPPAFSQRGAGVKTTDGKEHIQQILRNMFSVRAGERAAYPFFGSNLQAFVFAGIDNQQLISIEFAIKDSIVDYEPRIAVQNVSVDTLENNGSYLMIKIDYHILASELDDSIDISLPIEGV